MKTITLSDQTYAELASIFAGTPVVDPVPPIPPVTVGSTYPISRLMPRNTEPSPWDSDPTRADRMYLWKMQGSYGSALRTKMGAHQLFEDMLTNQFGKTLIELLGPPPTMAPTAASNSLQALINTCKNDVGSTYAAATNAYDINSYAGPLRAVYSALVAKKLAS